LNYDDLILTELSNASYSRDFCDLGAGYEEREIDNLLDVSFKVNPLRTKNNLQRRIKLLDLHGAVTFWKISSQNVKIPLAIARKSQLWEKYRAGEIDARPLVVLANQHDKIDHVKRDPFQLAYDVADTDFRDSDHWLIAGYSFRDTCVNDLLRRSWEVRRHRPRILIVTKGDNPTTNDVEHAFGWESGKLSHYRTQFERAGVVGLGETAKWKWFVGGDAPPPF
jgi:hypothetical protein